MGNEITGFFGSLRKVILPTDAEKAAKAQYLADSKPAGQPTPAPTQPTPASTQGISGYVGNGALDKRMKEAGLKKGGPVKPIMQGGSIKGQGGPTDDKVPLMGSNGEFMIKASSAKILGEDVLEALNDLGDEPKGKKADAKEDAKEGEKEGASKMKVGGAVRKMAIGGFVKDKQKTPTDIYQEQMAAAQEAKKAASSVPRRGDYSDANVQAYLAANDKANSLKPSYFTQETPTSSQNRAQAEHEANVALANIDLGQTQATSGAVPSQQAPQAAVPQTQSAQAGYRGKGYSDPRDPNSSAGVMDSELKNEFSNASTLARNPGGAVRKITDANGKVTGYSGGNVTGEVSMTDANGAPLRGNTRGISSMDTSAGYASDLKQLAEIQAGKDEQNANMQARADYAQNQVLQQKALQGNPAALALLKGRMASSDGRQAGQMTDQTTRRGQDLNAGAVRQTNQLARDKFNLDSTGTNLANRQTVNMMAIQKAMFDTNATQEQRDEATKQFMALNGKSQQQNKYTVVPGGQAVIDGQSVTQPSMVFDNETKQFINPNQGAQKANATSKADYDKLPPGSIYTGQDGKQYKKG